MMGRWDGNGWGWGAWFAMALMMVVVWTVVVAAVVVLVRGAGLGRVEHPTAGSGQDQALRILEERFAKGDIDAAEYTQRRDLLRLR